MIVPLNWISLEKSLSLIEPYVKTEMDLANPNHQKRVNKLVQVDLGV